MWSKTGLVDGKKKASTPGVLSAESGLRRRARRARRRQKAAVRHEACVALVGALTGLFRQTTAGHGTAEPGWLGQARTLVCNRTERKKHQGQDRAEHGHFAKTPTGYRIQRARLRKRRPVEGLIIRWGISIR